MTTPKDDKKPDPAVTPDPKTRDAGPTPEPLNLDDVRKSERERVREIEEMSKKFGIEDAVAQRAVNDGTPLEKYRDFVMATLLERDDDVTLDGKPAAQLDLTPKEVQGYSMMRAIQAILLARTGSGSARDLAPFEFECHDAIAERTGKSSEGILVPTDILIAPRQLTKDALQDLITRNAWAHVQREVKTRDLDSVTATGAAELVGTGSWARVFCRAWSVTSTFPSRPPPAKRRSCPRPGRRPRTNCRPGGFSFRRRRSATGRPTVGGLCCSPRPRSRAWCVTI